MKKLFAGFWVGEFGWELMTWIPHLRAVAKNYDHVIVGCKSGHECLYEFADEFVNFDYTGANSEQWFNKDYTDEAFLKGHHTLLAQDKGTTWLDPQQVYSYSMKTHKEWLTGLEPREFKKYGDFGAKLPNVDIVINIRNRTEHDSAFRNWDIGHAKEFVSHFKDKDIMCIGTQEQSLFIKFDGRQTMYNGVDAYTQSIINAILANAKVFVSSINGATHLASLCGCPQVAWVTKPEHGTRLEQTWNPFNTKTKIFLSPEGYWKNRTQWHPPVDELVKAVRSFL